MSFQRGVSRGSVYKNSLICIGDGDNIGDVIDFYLLSDNLEEASQFSSKVKVTLENIAELAESVSSKSFTPHRPQMLPTSHLVKER